MLMVASMLFSIVAPLSNIAHATGSSNSVPECPLSPRTGRIIVDFPDSWDLWDSLGHNEEGPISAFVPAGKYDITLVSYDDGHPNGGTQPHEQWYMEGFNGATSVITSTAIGDLPTDKTTRIELVDVAAVISDNITGIMTKHAYPPATPTANSITPICVVFDVVDDPVCDTCDGKVTELTLKYTGSVSGATITVEQKNPAMSVFGGVVNPGEEFSFVGKDDKGTFSTEISIYVNGVLNAKFHTSCSVPIGPGTVQGDFVVVNGESRNGGSLSCEEPKSSLTLIKHVINDDGGSASVSDFVLKVDTTVVTSGNALSVSPGDYVASEINLSGYQAGSWGGDCASDGSVSVGVGEDAVCEITNDDIEQPLVCPLTPQNDRTIVTFPDWRLRSDKDAQRSDGPMSISTLSAGVYNITLVSNDKSHPAGGTQPQEQWYLSLRDGSGEVLASNATTDLPDSQTQLAEKVNNRAYVTSDVNSLMAFHAAPKNAPTANSISPVCVAFDKQPDEPTITLVKKVINDDGGTAAIGDFTLKVDATVVTSGIAHVVTPGSYTASEINLPGYAAGSWSGDCAADGSVSVDYGDDAVCEIENDDKQRPTIKLVKKVINDDGGSLSASDFTLRVDSIDVSSGDVTSVDPGTYTASEIQHPDYDASTWSGDCDPNGSVSVDYGDDAVCTITNNDKPAPPDTTITLIKTVVNNNGGSAVVADFVLKVGTTTVTSGVPLIVAPGSYTASEVNLPDYAAGTWGGDCAANGSITLSLGDNAVCTITNDDVPKTSITLIKHVINDDGGTATISNFVLKIGATQVVSGVAEAVLPGSYTATEQNLPGYTASSWSGDCAADGSVTVAYGDNAVCEITNDDKQRPTITLVKNVINDNNGTAVVADFPLFVDTTSVVSGVALSVSPGSYSASEIGLSNYDAGNWSGDCAADGSVSVDYGDNAVCEITNNDIPPEPENPKLTLIKHVINNNGKTLGVSDFTLKVDATTVTSGVAVTLSPGTYTASEVQHSDYTASGWSGACASDGSVTLNYGDNLVCEITNDDKGGGGGSSPRLTIVKTVDPTFTNPDTTVTYTVVVTNTGYATAISVTMTDVLPDPYFSYSDGTLGLEKTWDLGHLAQNQSATIIFDADVSEDAVEGFYTNRASAKAKNNGEVFDTAVVEVRDGGVRGEDFFPRLEIEKTVSPSFTTAGGSATYTIVVRNVGEAVAENVTLVDLMPGQLSEVITAQSTLNWVIGDLAIGQEWSITFEVNVSEDAEVAIYRNHATADADNADPVKDYADIEIREGEVLGVHELPETGALDGAAGSMAAITLSSLIGFMGAAGFTLRRRNQTAADRLVVLSRKLQ